ncbi:MAG TPA: GNAT family N-acetyltransferase [Allosphingosinicella sp.]
MDFTLRLATVADVPAMHRIRLSARENRLSDPALVREADYLPFVARGAAFVAEADGALLGFAAADAPAGSVWALFVAPAAEGRGVGRALERRLLAWARAEGLKGLTLTTAPGTRAAAFYRAGGWTETGVTAAGELCFARAV